MSSHNTRVTQKLELLQVSLLLKKRKIRLDLVVNKSPKKTFRCLVKARVVYVWALGLLQYLAISRVKSDIFENFILI